MNRAAAFVDRHHRAVLAATLILLLALAWRNHFAQDDAFIAFRYADHLARGQGLVFNPGERVEGYTCFLYVLLIAAGIRIGLDPLVAANAIGLLAFLGSLLGAYALARRLGGDRLTGVLAVVLLGTHYTFSAYATGGLETQLQTCLVTAFLALGIAELAAPEPRPARHAALSAIAALALLTRVDSALLLLPLGVALAARAFRTGGRMDRRVASLAALILPAALLVGGWLAWKSGYYGSLLPNTFYAKVEGHLPILRGLFYLAQFVTSYWLMGAVLIALWMLRDLIAAGGSAVRVLLAALLLWNAYLVVVGGDFMEFRMLVPVLPIVASFLALTALLLERRARLGWALVALVIAGSVHHAFTYPFATHPHNESVYELNAHLYHRGEDWIASGHALRRDLGGDSTVVIATTAAGAIPYLSGLRTVDMLGLCDPWVARNGDPYTGTPGHSRVATLDYLIERGVTLVIAHPTPPRAGNGPVCFEDFPPPRFVAGERSGSKLPAGVGVLEIPVRPDLGMLAYYLGPSPAVEEAIRSRGWKRRAPADCTRGGIPR